MVALTAEEATALRQRLRQSPAGRPASGTIGVSANASTSVTFTGGEKLAVLEVLTEWAGSAGGGIGEGLVRLRDALAYDLNVRP
jgi:hypothetical protein